MKVVVIVSFLMAFCPWMAKAEVLPVSISTPKSTAWAGERVRILIELRANGSFSGSAGFDLPEMPGTLLIKVGNPVVGSKEFEGESWFIQTHEFALFSQKSGSLTIPSFPVRFERRDGFTGPAMEVVTKTEALMLEIRRPPGSENIPFLVTTESLSVEETWDPIPEAAIVGDIFRRTILQKAEGMTGMALSPAQTTSPEGARVYDPRVETNDTTERGVFTGERRDTLTYLLQQDGSITLPELNYTWWNPKSESLQSKTLPAVTIEVAATPVNATKGKEGTGRLFWARLMAIALILGLFVWQRQRVASSGKQCWRKLNPPDRVAARAFLRACRHHNVAAAETAWNAWKKTQNHGYQPSPELRTAVLGMQRFLFYPATESSWQGDLLARVFAEELSTVKAHSVHQPESILPLLNPRPGQR